MRDLWSHSIEWDKGYDLGHKVGYEQGAKDMEKAKQIIIDSLLKEIEHTRAEVIEEAKKICGGKIPSYTNCAYCLFATFKDDFDTTICKLEQLKEQQ